MNCPECGGEVEDFFDHVAVECPQDAERRLFLFEHNSSITKTSSLYLTS